MTLFKDFTTRENPRFGCIELAYSAFFWVSGNPCWFCRIWHKNWINRVAYGLKEFGESYGRTKFEAYHKALKDMEGVRKFTSHRIFNQLDKEKP